MNKVLIVEDDPVIAKSVADHLTTWQMQVRCAKDFEKIDEEATDFQPDIIIMDIKLPYYIIMAFIGVPRSEKIPGCRLCSCPRRMII